MPIKERHRSTLACARCYQMKKKCDKKAPSCSRCIQARQPCIGINRQKDIEVPRSVVQYLEQVSSKLHCGSASAGLTAETPAGPDAHIQLDLPQINHYSSVIQALRCAVLPICTTALIQSQPSLYHRNRLFYGSEPPPLKIHIGILQERPYQIRGSFSASKSRISDLLLVPFEFAKLLLNVYIENILPRYPCFLASELKQHFDAVYSKQDSEQEHNPPPEMSRFIVSMILAISSLTSKAHDFRKVATLSESLHRDALRHSQFLRRSNTSTLRCFLLLIQFALLLPHTSNLWYMTGEAMRMAIALGLHQEQVELLEPHEADLRRTIFWTTYILERTVCVTSGCPVAISDEHIQVNLPFEPEDNPTSPSLHSAQSHLHQKMQFLNIIRFRRMLTEIHAVQFFGHRLPDSVMDYNQWVEATDREIQNWQDHALSGHKVAPDWFTNAVCATRLMLHRPCLRNATPSDLSISKAVETAISMVHNCWKLSQTGYLIFPFHNVYNGFHAGIVLLYAIKHRAETCHSWELYGQVLEALALLTRVFSVLAERWPPAINTGYYFNELKEGVLRNIELASEPGDSLGDVNLLAELEHLVTDRQTSGDYHHNTTSAYTLPADTTTSPDWMRMQLFPFGTDETWEDFMNIGFGFENFDTLYASDNFDSLVPAAPVMTPPAPTTIPSDGIDESILAENLENVIESIPACNYCRNRRVKCSRRLPSCHACADSRRPCLYYDSVLSKDVLGSYIHALYTNIKNTISRGAVSDTASSGHIPAVSVGESIASFPRNVFIPTGERVDSSLSLVHSNDLHLSENDNKFFGSSSHLAALDLAISMRPGWTELQVAADKYLPRLAPEIEATDHQLLQKEAILPSYSTAAALIQSFSRSINMFYPTMQQHVLENLLSTAYGTPNTIHGTFEEQTLYIVLAIASYLTRSNDPSSIYTSNAYFMKGTSGDSIMHEKTSTSQVLLLQRSLLTCIYLLLNTGSGDVWRNLGFSVRLYFDMVHRPSDDESERDLAVTLYRTLYCLESQVAVAYGRPSLLAICDILRDDMLISTSSTIAERISIHFYKISFLKLQILNGTLSKTSRTLDHGSTLSHQEELQAWYDEWNCELDLFGPSEDQEVSKAWGQLQCFEALLFLSRANTSQSPTPAESQQLCDNFVQACTTLARNRGPHSNTKLTIDGQSSTPLFFPMVWTTAHAVFAAGLSLFQNKRSDLKVDGTMGRSIVLRRCLTLMASLEAEPNNMAAGFTAILEKFCSDEEQ